MIKKIVSVSALLLLTSTVAFATSAPYLGFGAGVLSNSAKSNNYRGLSGSLLAGWGGDINESFYLAGELGATLDSIQLNDNSGVGVKNLGTTYSYGLSLLPGFVISNHTKIFARLGAVRTRFNDIGQTSTGGELGLGLQTSITQNWDLRGEYDWIGYSKVGGFSPNSDQFNLSLLYKFA